MHRLLIPTLALLFACVDKTDTNTDTDSGTDTDMGTDSDVGTDTDSDTDSDTEGAAAQVTVYVATTDNEPLQDAVITLEDGTTGITNAEGLATLETTAGNTLTVRVAADGYTRSRQVVPVTDAQASVVALLNATEVQSIDSAADTILTFDDGLALQLYGGFEDRRGGNQSALVEVAVLDTPDRMRALPPAPDGYSIIRAADITFTRADEELSFDGRAVIAFPIPADFPRYRQDDLCLASYDENSNKWECEDECLKCGEDSYCGTTDHFTTFALLLQNAEETCLTVSVDEDDDWALSDLYVSATSTCGYGVVTAKLEADDTDYGQVCLPQCDDGNLQLRADTLATRTDNTQETASGRLQLMVTADEAQADFSFTAGDADNDGFTAAQGDCAPQDAAIYPGADDPLDDDGLDSNCDGLDGVDADGDGFISERDCNDNDRTIHPSRTDNGLFGNEDAGVDNDCDGNVDEDGDNDRDGFIALALGGQDCDDNNPSVHPDTIDETGDGLDTNCDGLDGTLVIVDVDRDGWSDGEDCDDNNPTIYPGAIERCDGVDSDCNGTPDRTNTFANTCLDARTFDDTYAGTYTLDFLGDNEVIESCSQPIGLTVQDGRIPRELMVEASSTPNCTMLFGDGSDIEIQTVAGFVAPTGYVHGTLVAVVNDVTHETPFEGSIRSATLTGRATIALEDPTFGVSSLSLSVRTRRAAVWTPPTETDADFDGYAAGEDCDDDDPTRRPGAIEACNGVDDNCDGSIADESCPTTVPADGRYRVDFEVLSDDGYAYTQTPPPPAIALLVEDEMSSVAQENPVFQGSGGAQVNVLSAGAMTANPPNSDGSINGTLTLQAQGQLPSGTYPWTGTTDGDSFSGIAVVYDRPLRRWTHVALTASAVIAPNANDEDFDGTPTDLDCDDTDPNRRMGAHEVCNGIDDNCDGGEDTPLDDVCPHMPWLGESYPITFSLRSSDGVNEWQDQVEAEVNIEQDGAFTVDNPIFTSPSGANISILAMSMNPPGGDETSITGVVTIESTVEGIESGQYEWTGNIDTFGISGFALVGSGPRHWTHIAISHTRSFR